MYIVSKTYDTIVLGSAELENGEPSESGFIFEPKQVRLKELLEVIKEIYYFDNFHPEHMSQSLYATDPIRDYNDGSETYEAIHIDASPRRMRRLNAILSTMFKK